MMLKRPIPIGGQMPLEGSVHRDRPLRFIPGCWRQAVGTNLLAGSVL